VMAWALKEEKRPQPDVRPAFAAS